MKRNLWLLHSVRDAKHALNKGLKKEDYIYSTHSSVEVYLKYEEGFKSKVLTSVISRNDVNKIIFKSFYDSEKILESLNVKYARIICDSIEIAEIDVFKSIYLHLFKHKLIGLRVALSALDKVISIHSDIRNIYIYKCKIQTSFTECLYNKRIEVYSTIDKSSEVSSLKDKFKELLVTMYYFYKSFLNHNNILFHKKCLSTVLYWGGLYDIQSILPHLKNHNQIVYPHPKNVTPLLYWKIHQKKTFKINNNNLPFCNDFPIVMLINDVIEDFNKKSNLYLTSLSVLSNLVVKKKINFAIWGNPPVSGIKGLCFNLLKKMKVTTIGFQHGSGYGYNDYFGQHIYTDYSTSDIFLSYGFTNKELNKHYQHLSEEQCYKLNKFRIIPVGKPIAGATNKKKQGEIDILYPLNNSISIFHKILRQFPELLTNLQEEILETINSYSNKKVIVKPFKNYGNQTCSVIPVLKRLSNAKVEKEHNFKFYLENYNIKCIVLDSINTTTLIETLIMTNTPIVLLVNSQEEHLISHDAIELLKNEIFIVKNKKDLHSIISGIMDGSIKNKQSKCFSDIYANAVTPQVAAEKINNIMKI